MNNESVAEKLYSVVGLDGKERNNVNLDTIKEWYFKREINESSLIFSSEIGKWQMLKRVLNLDEFKAEFYQRNSENSYPPPNVSGQFSQSSEYAQAFPEDFQPPNQSNSGYRNYSSQNQYDTSNSPAAQTNYQIIEETPRKGYRLASIFLLTNFFIWIVSSAIIAFYTSEPSAETDTAYQFGQEIGKNILKILIDLYLATKLWNAKDLENKVRIFTLIRTYIGSIIFLAITVPIFSAGLYINGFVLFGSIFFYGFGLLVILHGKEEPSPSRIMLGWLSFVLFIIFSVSSMYFSSNLMAESAEDSQFLNGLKKYQMQSNEFVDSENGVKITLPANWKQFSVPNPHIKEPHTRMIAMDSTEKIGAKLTVVPFPQKLDMSRINLSQALDKAFTVAEPNLKKETPSYKTIFSSSIYLDQKLVKRIVFERDSSKTGKKSKGHIIFTMDDQNMYILEMWTEEVNYQNALNDFTQFENNFLFQ